MNSENSARTPYRGWRGQRSLPGGDSSLGSGEGTQQGCYWGSWPHHSPSRSGTQNNPPASALLDSAVGVWGSQACPPHAKLPLARPSTPGGRWVEKAASQHPPAWPGPPHHKETAREFSRVPPPQGPAELQRTHTPCTEAVCAPGAAGARAAQELCRNVSPRRTVSPRRRGPRLAPRPGPVCTYPLATAGPCVGNHHAKAGGQWPPRHYPCPHPDCAALTVWGSCWGGPHARGGCTGHPAEPRPPGSGWGGGRGGGATGLQGPDKLSSSPGRIPRTVLGSALAAVQCPVPDPPAPPSPTVAGSHAGTVPLAPPVAHASVLMRLRVHVLMHQHTRAPMHRCSRAPMPSCSISPWTQLQPCGG